jgi:hypothetical protein
LKKGIATEKEHSKTLNKLYNQDINPNQAIREVAKEHIKEKPNYYSDLQKMEGKMAKGGTVMNSQDAENAIFDATVFEHGGTVNAYDAGLHKKMYMLGIEVMQPDPIALARVMSDENDNFCEHYPKLCAGAEYQREELPQIYDKNYDEFVAYLENLGATVNFEGDTAVDSLKPVQNEISLERMARIMARVKDGYYKDLNLLKLPLFVSQDGYILDGHHRWATLFFLSPTNTLDIYRVNLTYKELVDKALNFDDAGTEKFMIGGMVKKQEQLDTAEYKKVRFDKGEITFYFNFDDSLRYGDLVRIEGSSQALMSNMFKTPIFTFYGSLGNFICSCLNRELNDITSTLEKTKSFTKWSIITEPTVSKEKRSQAIDITFNYMRVSFGIRDWFDTGTNKYSRLVIELYCKATVNFIESIIRNLQEGDWTVPTLTLNDFLNTDRYRLAARVYKENIEKIITVVEEDLEQSRQNLQYDINKADLTLITSSTTKQPNNKNQNLTKSPQQAQQIIQQLQQGALQTTKFGVISKGEAYEFDNIDAVQQFVNDFIFEDDMLVTYGGKMVNIPKNSPAAEVKTILTDLYGWNWRFKTEQEFIDEYGVAWYVDANEDVEWNRERQEYDMDFLFGQPIAENPTSENAIDNLIEENDNYRVVNVDEYFGIKNPNPNGKVEYGIAKEFITDKPLPNAVTPTTQTTTKPLIKPLYYGLESSFTAFYPTIGRVKPENRFSYMNWEDVVKYYELAKKEGGLIVDAFCYAVAVVNNSSRMRGELNSNIVRGMLENNNPSDALKELFSNNYYFSPMYFDFYTSLYDKIEKSILNAGWNRVIVPNQKLQSLINIADTAANLGSVGTGQAGFAGLGNFRELNTGKIIYPDLITTEYESDQKNAYASNSHNLYNDVLVTYVENLSYNNDNWSDTILQKSAVPLIKTLSDSYYQYEDLSGVPTDMIYSPNSQSKLFDHTYSKGGISSHNDFIFWDFARPLLPQNFFIDADFIRLISNFKTDGYLDSKELDSLIDIGERLQIRSDLSNGSFLVKIQDLSFGKQFDVIYRMDTWDLLSNDQKVLFLKFMTLYNNIVESARKEIAKIFEETTTGVMQRSGVGSMPTSTQPAPTWNWRFKTEREFNKEYGNTWKKLLGWDLKGKMDYLFGQPLEEKPQGKIVINNFINNIFTASAVNTEGAFGLVSPTGENMWDFKVQMFTQQPLPTSATQNTPSTKEIPYIELLTSGTLTANQTIVGARFMSMQEMTDYNKKYETSFVGFLCACRDLNLSTYSVSERYQWYKDNMKDTQTETTLLEILGKKVNPLLLETVKEVFKFQNSSSSQRLKELFKTSDAAVNTDQLNRSRLRLGNSNFGFFDFWKPLFPEVTLNNYERTLRLDRIFESSNKFPIWYQNMIRAMANAKVLSANNPNTGLSYILDNTSVGGSVDYPFNFYTGLQVNDEFRAESWGFLTIPFSYLILEIQDDNATAKSKQTTTTKKVTKSVPLIQFLYEGVLQKNDKIVSARFLNQKEIAGLDRYQLSDAGFITTLNNSQPHPIGNSLSGIYKLEIDDWSKAIFGERLNPKLLPAVIEVFKFYKANNVDITEIKRTPFQDQTINRLALGRSSFADYIEYKKLFPNVSESDYTAIADNYARIKSAKFPEWYDAMIEEVIMSEYFYTGQSYTIKEAQEDYQTVDDIKYPYYLFTGIEDNDYRDVTRPYWVLPFAYLMVDIETEEQVLSSTLTNKSEIKKIKEEYSALQYYLNVEVPIDAFAQRKLITTVMEGVSDKLEKEIEALFYSPSFEPLFDFWAEKQTQGQRTIDLQPCMLPTPNGQKSELDLIQYEIVRSEEFKKWFGDWEEAAVTGNYNGVSRAINPLTKEPQVAFHGKANMALEFTKMAFATFPVKYFGTNLSYAEWFKENQSKSDRLTKLVYEFFLDIKNPIDLSPIGLTELTAEEFKELIKAQYNYDIQSRLHDEGTGKKNKLWVLIRFSQQMLEELKANTYFDGFIMYEDNSQDLTASGYDTNLLGFSPNSYELVQQVAGTPIGNFTLDFVTFTNFQIKAADGRNTTFFNNVEDFRFAKGGITKKRKK